ncbi:hypothetical protein AB0J83_39355 [Actinoplanes sp. NPDC049596]|uniref:hypothetical protein n=1 Tax=unclassified Actinoplanes TaxID=2626549 RepID=UPI00342E9B76
MVGVSATFFVALIARPVERAWDQALGDPAPAATTATTSPPSATLAPPGVESPSVEPPTSEPAAEPNSESPSLEPEETTDPPGPAIAEAPTTAYLSDLRALKNSYGNGPYSIAGKTYDQSVRKYCGTPSSSSSQVWPVAGYAKFSATVGIADDEQDGLDRIAHVSFKDQSGNELTNPFDVRLGQSHRVEFDLKGTVQLQILCVGKDTKTGNPRGLFGVVMGDARIDQ